MTKDIKKELIYSLRSNRLLIVCATFLFFGILTPLMTKVFLPAIFRSQFPGITDVIMAEMIDMSQTGSLRSFFNDMFEMGTLIITFSLCGLMALELKEHTLVIPLCSGKQVSHMVLAKFIVFSLIITAAMVMAVSVSYVYAGLLFEFEMAYTILLKAGLLQSLYLVFILSCLLFFGSLIKVPIATGFLTLGLAYGTQAIGGLLDMVDWIPAGLVNEAQALSADTSANIMLTIAMTVIIITAMIMGTVFRLRTMELNDR